MDLSATLCSCRNRGSRRDEDALLRAIPANIAVLDRTGKIVRTNEAWDAFGEADGVYMGVGVNYLAMCDLAEGEDAEQAQEFATGIRSVIGGERDRFSMDYSCHSPTKQRWFAGYVTRLAGDDTGSVVLVHIDITDRKRAEEALKRVHDELDERVRERTEELQRSNAALRASEETLRIIADNVPNGGIYQFVRTADGNGRYSYMSEGVGRLRGVSASKALLAPELFDATIHPEDIKRMREAEGKSARTLTPFEVESPIRTPWGEIKWLHWHSAPRRLEDGGTLWDGVIVDITARKAAEAALQRANRSLLALKDCNEALMRAKSEPELLERICRIVTDCGGARLAWVGFAEYDENKSIRLAACAGPAKAYLKDLQLTWKDEPKGRGMAGIAIRTGKVVVSPAIGIDDRMTPWRTEILKHKLASTISLPLVWEGRCLGVFALYSNDVDAYKDQEVELLQQLAGDLTYGIVALRNQAERKMLEGELLKISEREKHLISQELHDGLCQNLAGTAMMGSLLHRRLLARKDEDAEYARQICDLLNLSVNEARNLSHGLHPVGPEGEGLMNALSQLAGTVTNLFHIRCTFRCPEPVILENEIASTHLLRITQEAINNARKHGEAGRVLIGLLNTPKGITLTIHDNGIGIPQDLPKKNGMGLRSMNHRASEIGATLTVRRAGKRGTVVTCSLPHPGQEPRTLPGGLPVADLHKICHGAAGIGKRGEIGRGAKLGGEG